MSILNRKVLVLNKLWTAVRIATLERAIVLLFSQYKNGEPKAKVIDSESFATYDWSDWSKMKPADGEGFIQAGHSQFKIPEVILLTRYDKLPKQRVNFSRRTMYKRDNFTCQYCGCKPGSEELAIDHVVPKSYGGQTTWENCVLSCTDCNAKKANSVPKGYDHTGIPSISMQLRKQPKKPNFQLFKGDIPDSWNAFISKAYWEVELKNDEPDE